MTHRAYAPIRSDLHGQLNQALLDHGRKAVTTSPTGGVDLPMLLVEMGRLAFSPTPCVVDASGFFRAGFTHAGPATGSPAAVTEATSPSRESAIVEAAIAALGKR